LLIAGPQDAVPARAGQLGLAAPPVRERRGCLGRDRLGGRAPFGDFLTKPLANGGLDLTREHASLITFGLLALVLFASMRMPRKEVVSVR
jgi:hypothetical protein